MKDLRFRVIFFTTVSMLIAFAAILLTFNLVMDRYVTVRAENSIKEYMNLLTKYSAISTSDASVADPDTSSPWFVYNVGIFSLDRNYQPLSDNLPYMAPSEKSITAWLNRNRIPNESITRADISGFHYDLARQELADGTVYVYYVDITSEKSLVLLVNVLFLSIMAICAVIGIFSGIRLGRIIDENKKLEKQYFENASHELKTPLMTIQGYAEGLQNGIVADEQKAFRIMIDETDKIAGLIDEALNFARMENGEIKLQTEHIPIQDLLNDCLSSVEIQATKKGLIIKASIADDIITADPVQMEHAITNILSNAIRYAKSTITVSYAHRKLIIHNDGNPIARKDLRRIFDRFYIGEKGHTGIGLSLTKEIILRHGWDINAANTDDGVDFIITLGPADPPGKVAATRKTGGSASGL